MAHTLSSITKYLHLDQKKLIALDLSKHLISRHDNVTAFCDLVSELDPETLDEVYPEIRRFVVSVANGDLPGSEYPSVLLLTSALPRLSSDILRHCSAQLSSYLSSSLPRFLSSFKSEILPYLERALAKHDNSSSDNPQIESSDDSPQKESSDDNQHSELSDDNPQKESSDDNQHIELSDDFVVALFEFLEYFFINSPIRDTEASTLDDIIMFYTGHEEDKVSKLAMQCLRWRIGPIVSTKKNSKFVWDIVFALEQSHIKSNMDYAFIIWLRFLGYEDGRLDQSSLFQNEILDSQHYWQVLQHGLVSDAHEHRRFCLSIIQLSVKLIRKSIENEIFSWDSSKSDQYLKEWARFSTLFEILGIDTSLHQAQGAMHDILSLLSPNSLIHPSWGFGLLSTGFKAGMDSVRKFSLSILLSIPDQNLYLLKYSLPFFEKTYLPYAMLASHYIVRQTENTHDFFCEHGEKLSRFISNLLSNLSTDDEYKTVVRSILSVLLDLKDSFDPARIYVTYGMVEGLQKKRVLQLGDHDSYLIKLIETSSEGPVLETTSQTLNLMLLLNFKLTSPSSFLDVLRKFIKFNGYRVFNNNLKRLVDYLHDCSITVEDLNEIFSKEDTLVDTKVIIAVLIRQFDETFVLDESSDLVARLLQTGVGFHDEQSLKVLIHNVVSGEADERLYDSLGHVDFSQYQKALPPKIKLIELWASINEDVQSEENHILKRGLSKFRVFNNIYGVYEMLNIENHEIFNVSTVHKFKEEVFLVNSSSASRTVNLFYKTKDAHFGQLYKLLANITSKGPISQSEIDKILGMLITSSDNHEINWYTAVLLNNVVKQEDLSPDLISRVVEVLSSIWLNLCSSRLQLNQKNLHVLLIETLMHPLILSHAVSDEHVSSKLLEFSKLVVANSQGRRCLLPTLTKHLSNFQIKDPAAFEALPFIPEVLVLCFISFQLRSNIFRLENIIASLYDEKLCSVKQNDMYKEFYGHDEISGRIYAFTMLNSIKSAELSNKVFDFIYHVEDNFNLFNVVKKTDGFQEWRRIQLFTIILSVVDSIDQGSVLDRFITLLESEPSPLARVYLEWIIAKMLIKNPSFIDVFFQKLKEGIESNNLKPTVVTAYERTLFLSIQHFSMSKESEYLTKFLAVLIPGATSNKAVTRHFSLSLICAIYPEIKRKNLAINSDIIQMSENLYKSAISSESFETFRSGDALLWDVIHDYTLVGMTGGVLLRVSDRVDIDFIRKKDFEEYLSPSQIHNLQHAVGDELKELWVRTRKQQISEHLMTGKHKDTEASAEKTTLQTKSGAWSSVLDVDESSRGSDITRSDLIVVSSLVDKPPNLGGICRLCDVLGAGLLTLNDARVKNHAQFKNVAVTADYWMPMIEVRSENILKFMREKKKEGYTLIGLEQTTNSIELNADLKFPKKSLILLGKEKEGVPGELLAELDMCVEIKQVGVIRSMNIQTAAAIVVHAYSTQHC